MPKPKSPPAQAPGSEIHLGDLARALAALAPKNAAEADTIARSLGFALPAERPATSPNTRPASVFDPTAQPTEHPGPQTERQTEPPPIPLPPLPETPPVLPEGTLPSRLTPLTDSRSPPPPAPEPPWLGQAPDATGLWDQPAPRLAREPLFPERTGRHILGSALALTRRASDIDLPELVNALIRARSRREPLRELPHASEATLRHGCDLLLDYSPAMVPWWDDLGGLIDQVGAVVGAEHTRVYSFDTNPDGALRWLPGDQQQPWQPSERPVLAATDLGIQHQTRARTDPGWHRLGERCLAAGVPLLILVPWPEPHWPSALAGAPTLIHWSPTTSAGRLHATLKRTRGADS